MRGQPVSRRMGGTVARRPLTLPAPRPAGHAPATRETAVLAEELAVRLAAWYAR